MDKPLWWRESNPFKDSHPELQPTADIFLISEPYFKQKIPLNNRCLRAARVVIETAMDALLRKAPPGAHIALPPDKGV